jgi:hypothetical protein
MQSFNPNPHCFIALTKATACGCKKPLLPHPLHSPVGGKGGEGCYLYGSEDLLNKNVSYTLIIIKCSLKMTFLVETP